MSAERKTIFRRATTRQLDKPGIELETHDDGQIGESMPPVGKMGGDTFRATPPARRPRAKEHPRTDAVSDIDNRPLQVAAPRTKELARVEPQPRAQAQPGQPHKRRWVLKLAWSIVGIVSVIALLLVALAVSTGRISLVAPPARTAVDLRGGDLQGADLQGADLDRADLHGADLRGANLRGANAQRANLRGANLAQADLHYALLGDADLREADLRGANMQWMDLQHANLSGAQLEGANIRNARLEGAILPDGTRWSASIDMRRFTDPAYPDFWRP